MIGPVRDHIGLPTTPRPVAGIGLAIIASLGLGCGTAPPPSPRAEEPASSVGPGDTIPSPTPAQWTALASLPDWSGVWTPNWTDQVAQVQSNPLPWKPDYGARVARMIAEDVAGRPAGLFVNCLPEGMPSWMLINHNAIEFLFTPGRVTILGESDGNRLRRIYTDGRTHPDDPAPTFHGHSIGHWEGDTLVVDTVGIIPQSLDRKSTRLNSSHT